MKDSFSFSALRHAFTSRHEPEMLTLVARQFWVLVLSIIGILVAAGIAFGAWQFFVVPESVAIDPGNQSITGFNKAQLKLIVESFGKRQAAFEAMMSGE